MTEGIIKNLSLWEKQNRAEITDFEDGCLLDNMSFSCKNGIAFIFEEYVNEWSSRYHMYFFRTNKDGSLKTKSDIRELTKCESRFENLKVDFVV